MDPSRTDFQLGFERLEAALDVGEGFVARDDFFGGDLMESGDPFRNGRWEQRFGKAGSRDCDLEDNLFQ